MIGDWQDEWDLERRGSYRSVNRHDTCRGAAYLNKKMQRTAGEAFFFLLLAHWPAAADFGRQAGKEEGLLCLLTLRYNGNMMNDTTWEKSTWH